MDLGRERCQLVPREKAKATLQQLFVFGRRAPIRDDQGLEAKGKNQGRRGKKVAGRTEKHRGVVESTQRNEGE